MAGHFRAFQGHGTGNWNTAADNVYSFYNAHSGSNGLVPDFFYGTNPATGSNAIEDDVTDGQYYYNACRVPLRFAMDYATSKNSSAQAALTKLNNFISSAASNSADNIAPGYKLDGTPRVAIGSSNWFTDLVFVGPFGAGLIASDKQSFMDDIWSALQDNGMYDTGDEGAYSYAVGILSQIVMTGNWWGPNSTVVTTPTAPTDIALSNNTI